MKAKNFSIDAYLERIKYHGDVSASLETVCAVMEHHLRAIPFENIDVQLGLPVSYDLDDIVKKLVNNARGGYCYEQNGLFAQFLEYLEIPYHFVGCRPMFYPERRPRTHMAIVANINDEQWLCDLGFGALGAASPLNIDDLETEHQQGSDVFRIRLGEKGYRIVEAQVGGEWQRQYGFNLSEFEWLDFMPANYFNSTHPNSFFVQNLVLLIKTENGRKSLFGTTYKVLENAVFSEEQVDTNNMSDVLVEEFFIPSDTVEELIGALENVQKN